ncbi:MAG: M50 family metallopeptidase [Anaerorhabdus sp.]
MTFVYFILIMLAIILVHEIGHLVAAKIFKVYCYEFSFGMGPKLYSFQGKETKYSIRLLPIGGFVQMAGEIEDEKELYPEIYVPKERSFKNISHYKKIIILFAGVFMNILLAWFIVSGIILSVGSYALPNKTIIAGVAENSPAASAGFKINDEIIKVKLSDGTIIKPKTFDDFAVFTQTYPDEITYTVKRDEKLIDIDVKGQLDEGRYVIGIMQPEIEFVEVNFFSSFKYGFDYLSTQTKTLFKSLTRLIQGNGLEQMSGPVGIYKITDTQVQYGFKNVLLLVAVLSLNIGIFNLIPLPALDGGRIILVLYEWISGKKVNKKIETYLIGFSFMLLMLMVVLVTAQDILRLF